MFLEDGSAVPLPVPRLRYYGEVKAQITLNMEVAAAVQTLARERGEALATCLAALIAGALRSMGRLE